MGALSRPGAAQGESISPLLGHVLGCPRQSPPQLVDPSLNDERQGMP